MIKWHSRGQRFDPAYLHQKKTVIQKDGCFSFAAEVSGLPSASAERFVTKHERSEYPAYLHQRAAKLSKKSLFSSENRDFSLQKVWAETSPFQTAARIRSPIPSIPCSPHL